MSYIQICAIMMCVIKGLHSINMHLYSIGNDVKHI